MIRRLPRTVGLLTAGFGALSVARPALMSKALGQTDAIGVVPPSMVILSQTIGVRDVASGLAMALLPAGRTRTAVIAAHVLGDVALGAVLTGALVDPAVRRRAGAVSWGWAGVVAVAGVLGGGARAAGSVHDRVADTVAAHREG